MGQSLLRAHLALCPAPPLAPMSHADMAALTWTPDDAA
jgi:hypothetical protein